MFFQRVVTSNLAVNSYLIGDEKTKQCVVIDPTRHVTPFIIQAQNADLDIVAILETHVHADFVSGSKELKHQLNDKPLIYASGMGGKEWLPAYVDKVVDKGTRLKIGDIRLEALHTPGHSPEHIIWVCYDESRSVEIPWFAFTGDCVFVGSVGRPDLLREQSSTLYSSLYQTLFETLAVLPDFLEIFPSHGKGSLCGKSLSERPTSTLGYERLFNPYFKEKPREQWFQGLIEGLPPVPAYFKRLKKINLLGPALLCSLKTLKWNSSEEAPSLQDLFLLDTRHLEVFAASYLKGSLNISPSATFAYWAGWMLPEKTPIGLIVEQSYVYTDIVDQLRLMGFDQEIGVIQMGKNEESLTWPKDSLGIIEADELAKRQADLESIYLLDVRTPCEWQTGHVQGAHHIELNNLEDFLPQLPQNETIALICKSGYRASLAASLLKKQGFKSVLNVRGGMQSWKEAGLPIVKEEPLFEFTSL